MTHDFLMSPLVTKAQDGEWLELGDHRARALVSSADNDGTFLLAEVTADFLGGVPPHIHRREDETFVVLQGNFEVMLGERKICATHGDSIFAPRGIPHAWHCISENGGRLLLLVTPGRNFESFARELSAQLPHPLESQNMDALFALAEKHGMVMLPPTW